MFSESELDEVTDDLMQLSDSAVNELIVDLLLLIYESPHTSSLDDLRLDHTIITIIGELQTILINRS